MGSIQASIDLQDNFTGVILNINRAVEMSVARMERMQAVMSEPVDTSSLQGLGNQVNWLRIRYKDWMLPCVVFQCQFWKESRCQWKQW